jgi:uncharacterized protein (TIGR03086 family)
MAENPLAQFDRAVAVANDVIAAVKPDQLDHPTPCTDWSVRQLLNHLVGGNLMFASIVTDAPRPDRSVDHLGDDPLGAFQDTVLDLRTLFSADGVLAATYDTPIGRGPGSQLVTMRVVEMTVHSWDLAKATGQSTDLDPELAEECLVTLRAATARGRDGGPFGPERPAPEGASAADRLAAFAGRAVD